MSQSCMGSTRKETETAVGQSAVNSNPYIRPWSLTIQHFAVISGNFTSRTVRSFTHSLADALLNRQHTQQKLEKTQAPLAVFSVVLKLKDVSRVVPKVLTL